MIWDLHCHLSGVEGRTPDERIANLMKYADRMGIERLVFFMGFPFAPNPSPAEFRRQNDQVIQALSHWHDRAFGFAYINPNHLDESLLEIDRCIRDGPMVGIKLWVAMNCDHKHLDLIVRRAWKYKAVIFQHTWQKTTGNLDGESTPNDLVALAGRHPDIPMICGHTGGNWELGIRAVRRAKNVSIGTGGSDPTAGFLEMAVRELGADRVIYGSDIGGRSFASQLAKVREAEISVDAKRLVLGQNLKRMLSGILNEKGVRF
ncbi:MAG: amidohydrolase family protein [Pirellulaceae bacterium]|nr:amidohydrolase family protein [Pirellulaceae bacterium]